MNFQTDSRYCAGSEQLPKSIWKRNEDMTDAGCLSIGYRRNDAAPKAETHLTYDPL
ncbi:hypothetical protein K040078D81_39220 [Blautia hominis]|uniref:Uncharacterized protein n=1 Tax=Blautia hominis TaxID=2025493 RepID=A0ABQ0BEB5_9FIRM